jgi:hypothetical protein
MREAHRQGSRESAVAKIDPACDRCGERSQIPPIVSLASGSASSDRPTAKLRGPAVPIATRP